MPTRASSPPRRRGAAALPDRRRAPAKARRRAGLPRDRAATVAAIIAAATDLVARKGPDGFGLAELGSRAGVSFGLIHRYFGGKSGLLKETLRQPFARQLARVLELYAGGEAARGPAPVVALLFAAHERNPDYVRLIAWGILTGLLTDDVFAAHRPTVARLLASYRRDLQASGSSAIDARAVAALLLTATLGFQLFRPLLHSLFETDARFDAAYQQHLEMALESFWQAIPFRPRAVRASRASSDDPRRPKQIRAPGTRARPR